METQFIESAHDNYVHEVYKELFETLNEGTHQIRVNIGGEAEVITNNGYVYHPYVQDMDGSIFFRGQRIDRPKQASSGIWFSASQYPELAKMVRKILPDVVEKENNYKIELLKAN